MKTKKTLETFSTEKVANVFKKMFSIRKKADNILLDYFKLENKHKLVQKCDNELVDDFYSKFMNIRESFVNNNIKQDKVLKKLDGIEII